MVHSDVVDAGKPVRPAHGKVGLRCRGKSGRPSGPAPARMDDGHLGVTLAIRSYLSAPAHHCKATPLT